MLTLLLAALSQPAQAAPLTESFRQTCRLISARPGRLTALCLTSHGAWVRSALWDWRDCPGDVANREGLLRCEVSIPGGSYQETCVEVVHSGMDLEATCERMDGNWTRSWLPAIDQCAGDIANIDGVLRCAR
ncbi:MAG: hypothetical protein ACI8RZ_001773 [Myxococcota bacterium]|jgi:hypothetical protein